MATALVLPPITISMSSSAAKPEASTSSSSGSSVNVLSGSASPVTKAADSVDALFRDNKLLARAMETDVTRNFSDRKKVNFQTFDHEMAGLQSAKKLSNVSCTLLVPNNTVATYKPYGFLFNAKTSQVLHAATHDILSTTTLDGTLDAPAESMTVGQLADYIQKTHISERFSMNEVNANFGVENLVGLFVVESDDPMMQIDILLVQAMLKEKYKLDLPLYSYNQQKGELKPFDTKGKIAMLLLRAKTRMGIPFVQAIAPTFGYTVSDKGRIQAS